MAQRTQHPWWLPHVELVAVLAVMVVTTWLTRHWAPVAVLALLAVVVLRSDLSVAVDRDDKSLTVRATAPTLQSTDRPRAS